MKRYIKCNQDIEIQFNVVEELSSDQLSNIKSKILDILNEHNAIQYVASVQVNIGGLSTSDIRVFSNNRVAQCRVTSISSNPKKAIPTLLSKLESNIDNFVSRNEEFLENKSNPNKKSSYASQVRKCIYDTFGIKPNVTYYNTNTVKLVYYKPFEFLDEATKQSIPKNLPLFKAQPYMNQIETEVIECITSAGLLDYVDVGINYMYHGVLEIRVVKD